MHIISRIQYLPDQDLKKYVDVYIKKKHHNELYMLYLLTDKLVFKKLK